MTYFVTFRTADSVPQALLRQWHAERDDWLRRHDVEPNAIDWRTRLAAQPEREFNAKVNNKLKLHQVYRKLNKRSRMSSPSAPPTIGTCRSPTAPQRREPECGDGVPVPQDLPAQPPSARSLTGVSNPTGYHSTPPCMVITIRAVGNQISYRLKRAIDCPIIWGLADRYVQSIHAQLFERTTSWLTVLYKQKYYSM